LDRWRAPEAAVLAARADGELPLLRVPAAGPPVLVTLDRGDGDVRVCRSYVDAVLAAGGAPVLVPPGEVERAAVLAAGVALVITGGAFDIHPHHYGQGVAARLDRVDEGRTELELALARAALAADLPVLGVCGGMQVLAVAAGGSLIQDLPADPAHEQPTDPAEPWHDVALTGGLAAWLGPALRVNSTHHQAVDAPGEGFVVEGRSPDGVIEATRHPGHRFAVGVQWHPERQGDVRLYERLVRAARA
jgi:putative glutamine amidotransferase